MCYGNAVTLTPAGSAAIGVEHVAPKPPGPEDWLVERCIADPRAAAEQIATLLWHLAGAKDEIKRLKDEISRARGAAVKRSRIRTKRGIVMSGR